MPTAGIRARPRSREAAGNWYFSWDAPRSEELDEGSLAAVEHLGVEILGGEINGAGVSAKHQTHEGDREERDTHVDQNLSGWSSPLVPKYDPYFTI